MINGVIKRTDWRYYLSYAFLPCGRTFLLHLYWHGSNTAKWKTMLRLHLMRVVTDGISRFLIPCISFYMTALNAWKRYFTPWTNRNMPTKVQTKICYASVKHYMQMSSFMVLYVWVNFCQPFYCSSFRLDGNNGIFKFVPSTN